MGESNLTAFIVIISLISLSFLSAEAHADEGYSIDPSGRSWNVDVGDSVKLVWTIENLGDMATLDFKVYYPEDCPTSFGKEEFSLEPGETMFITQEIEPAPEWVTNAYYVFDWDVKWRGVDMEEPGDNAFQLTIEYGNDEMPGGNLTAEQTGWMEENAATISPYLWLALLGSAVVAVASTAHLQRKKEGSM